MKDSDTGERVRRFAILMWSGAGGFLGALAGLLLTRSRGWPAIPTLLGLFLVGAALVYFIADKLSVITGHALASILVPSGRSTPARPEFSRADSLVARGRYQEAADAYAQHAAASPLDAEPCARLARLYRDRLKDSESAAAWLRQARDRAATPAEEHLLTRELVEVLVKRLGSIPRALPELARLADRHGGTPGGAWARAELRILKAQLEVSREGENHGV